MPKVLPKYRLKINPGKKSFVRAVSLVGDPAMESMHISFSKEQRDITFSANEERMELIGAAIIPDKLIYRKDKATGREYEVYFTKEDIRAITQDFMYNSRQGNTNLEHNQKDEAGAFIFQSYIVEHEFGQYGPPSLNLPEGTLVLGMKVQNEETWKAIKTGEFNGFSIEGIFEMYQEQFSAAIADEENNHTEEVLAFNDFLLKLLNEK